MKKILFITKDLYSKGGINRVVSILANELVKKYQIEILSISQTSITPVYHFSPNIKYSFIYSHTVNIRNVIIPLWLYFKKMNKNRHYEYIISECTSLNLSLLLCKTKKTKYICCEHTYYGNGKFLGTNRIGQIISTFLADKIVTLTNLDREVYIKHCDCKKVFCIPNPISEELWQNTVQYPYNKKSKKIISFGRLSYEKGFDQIPTIFSLIHQKHPDWQWHIYGSGDQKENIIRKIKENHLQEHIIMYENTPNITDFLHEYSICVVPSRYEGFGLSIIESLACGIPVIAFNVKYGPCEILDVDYLRENLANAFNIKQVADKISYLIQNEKKRIEISEYAKEYSKKFHISTILNLWEKHIFNN